MATSTISALVVDVPEGGKPSLVKKLISPPFLKPNQALVKVKNVAQNPTDVQAFDSNAFGDSVVLGCDFAGTVEKVDDTVKKLSTGDQVAGLIWGGEIKGLGGYSEYTIAHENISFKVPPNISLAEAATVPLASATAWLALFSKDCLAIDRNASDTTVLIWGGSSSVGLYAIQIAALQGFNIITTCSPRHFDLVKSLGATHAFDYKESDVADKIKEAAPDLKYVFDTIGNETSSVTASKAIDKNGGTLCTTRPTKEHTENVTGQTKVTCVLVWTAFLTDHEYSGIRWPASEDDHKLATELFGQLPEWIEAGKIKPNKPKFIQGGLDGIEEGFQMYRDGKISAEKIVYEL